MLLCIALNYKLSFWLSNANEPLFRISKAQLVWEKNSELKHLCTYTFIAANKGDLFFADINVQAHI